MFCCFFSCEVPDHKPIPVQHPSPRSPRALGEVHLGVHHPFGHRALLHRVRLEADGAHMEPLGTAGSRCSRLKLKLETDRLPFRGAPFTIQILLAFCVGMSRLALQNGAARP